MQEKWELHINRNLQLRLEILELLLLGRQKKTIIIQPKLAARVEGALNNVLKVIVMALFIVIDTAEDGVGEVDADLGGGEWVSTRN
jgi:hypothetical protein